MADPRYYAKIDVGYFDNPKIGPLMDDEPRVVMIHLRAILYCRQHLTDGRFPIKQVVRLASGSYCQSQCEPHCEPQCDFCKGVDAGLFERVDDRTAEVHDYLEHQESAARVIRRKQAAQENAKSRWQSGSDANGTANGNANRTANGNAEERRGEESSRRTPRATQLPDDWSPTDEHKVRAKESGLDLSWQATKFRLYHEEKGKTSKNWNASFTRWLMNAKDFERPAPAFQQRLDAERDRADKAWGAA